LLLGSTKSIEVTKKQLFASLNKSGVAFHLEYFRGYPSLEKAKSYASQYGNAIEAVVGVGGGRVIDAAKTIGDILHIPVITIPTIAATCAAWAAISVLYDESGHFVEVRQNEHAPSLVLVDTKILISAPARYTHAGIIDTFAKWYEINHYLNDAKSDLNFHLINNVSKQAYQTLIVHGRQALQDAKRGIVDEAAIQTIDAIIYLAGLAGSFKTERPYHGIAHTFYNLASQVVVAPNLLHGEKIAFALVWQQVLRRSDAEEIKRTLQLFSKYDNLFTLKDFGITDDVENKILAIAARITTVFEKDLLLKKYSDVGNIVKTLHYTSEIIEKYQPVKIKESIATVQRRYVKREAYGRVYVQLDRNENAFGHSPLVDVAIKNALSRLSCYPDLFADKLVRKLAKIHGVNEGNIVTGNGSFELINTIAQVFLNPGDEAITSLTTFEWYKTASLVANASVVEAPLNENHSIALADIEKAINDKTKLIWLCNPNNPTGTALDENEILSFLEVVPSGVLVVIDEAYIDFVREITPYNSIPLTKKHKNVILLRTFSKVHGLASLRIGYAIGDEYLIQAMRTFKTPMSTNYLAIESALASLEDTGFYLYSLKQTAGQLDYFYHEFDRLNLPYIRSNANFVMVNLLRETGDFVALLKDKGILIRGGTEFAYPDWIRITVGTEQDNKRVIELLTEYLKQ
jgi:histidinol-phosphate aminotransferase